MMIWNWQGKTMTPDVSLTNPPSRLLRPSGNLTFLIISALSWSSLSSWYWTSAWSKSWYDQPFVRLVIRSRWRFTPEGLHTTAVWGSDDKLETSSSSYFRHYRHFPLSFFDGIVPSRSQVCCPSVNNFPSEVAMANLIFKIILVFSFDIFDISRKWQHTPLLPDVHI